MGNYTKIFTKLKLREDTPEPVLKMVQALVDDSSHELSPLSKPFSFCGMEFDDPFFYNDRWYCIFGSYCANKKDYARFENLILDVRSECKAWDDLVYQFVKWVEPYIDTAYAENLVTTKYEDLDSYIWRVYPLPQDKHACEFNTNLYRSQNDRRNHYY